MKTVLKFTVMAALLLNTVTAMANEPKMKLIADSNAKSLVFELDVISKDAKIQFADSENNIIYSDNSLSTKGLRKKFDLSNLEKGIYTFKLEDETKIVSYIILIEAEAISILEKGEKLKPIFREKENMVYVNLLNLAMKNVAIKVFDSSDRLLFSEVIDDKLIVEKAFNFKNAHKGEYTIFVTTAEGIYTKNVIK